MTEFPSASAGIYTGALLIGDSEERIKTVR